jgi:predicted XRE-type DNA-binding protein
LSRSEASALKVKATLLDAILREIETRGYTKRELVQILDEYQPSVSNLVRGKIAKVSLEKLLTYSDRLKMKTTLTVHARARESTVVHEFIPVCGLVRMHEVVRGSRTVRRHAAAIG